MTTHEMHNRSSASETLASGQVADRPPLDVVVELEHRRGCWTAPVILEKHGLTCGNAESGCRTMLADLGFERFSCGIPAEFRGINWVAYARVP